MFFLMNEFWSPANWNKLQLISLYIQNKNSEKENDGYVLPKYFWGKIQHWHIYNWNGKTSAVVPDARKRAKQYREILDRS